MRKREILDSQKRKRKEKKRRNKRKKKRCYIETKVRIAYCLIQYSTFCQRSTHPLFMHLFLSCQSLSGRNAQFYSGCYRFLPPSKCTLSGRTRKEIYEPSGGSSKSECYLFYVCAYVYTDTRNAHAHTPNARNTMSFPFPERRKIKARK
ncbi:hypothetical protein V1478_017265 [Vespula squamosa]|uniref:Uncharacterized protein n=1 Tax=Vespula squamosa TaxID=30214 RepID=A0ABD1ZXH5_VESSQ